MPRTTTIGRYVTQRLEQCGLKHVFGIPGDYVLSFYDQLVASNLNVVGTCTEAGAGFAADAYARVHGLGCVCVTYCVGGLNTLNAVGGAYAEKSPLILISGAPGLGERAKNPLLHHQIRDYKTQKQIFEKVTVAAEAIEDPKTAPQQIDHVIKSCLQYKRPVYLELPRDIVNEPCAAPKPWKIEQPKSDPKVLKEAVEEAVQMLKAAKRPVILGGVEIHRFHLQEPLLKLVESTGMPIATTLLGKSIIRENHPQYMGVYEGAVGQEHVRKAVEDADCVLILGAFMTDINLGIYTANININRTIDANSENLSIKHHHFDDVTLKDFIRRLTQAGIKKKRALPKKKATKPIRLQPRKPITVRRLFERMNSYIDENSIVIADIGDSLFGASDLTIHRRTEFLSPAYYTSMGFAIPAAAGAQIGNKKLRPIAFVGDGAFQMTCQELGTIARYNLNPIVFVLNNKGYTTERFIHEGPYNDIHEWAYHLWPQLTRRGWGCEVRLEGELEDALEHARTNTRSYSIINVHLEKMDHSKALERLGKRLGTRVK